jgi:hypothetical protein
MIIGNSLESELAESEFLRRELRVKWRVSCEDDLVTEVLNNWGVQKRTLIVASDVRRYDSLLNNCPSDSIVFFILSDEAYSPRALRIAKHKSIRVIFRHYDIRPLSLIQSVLLVLESTHLITYRGLRLLSFFKIVLQGFRSRIRMNRWNKLAVPVEICPLGYTSKFAQSFCELYEEEIAENDSLFCLKVEAWEKRDYAYSFRGNYGQLQRRYMISQIEGGSEIADIVTSGSGWNGSFESELSARDYIQSLLRSKKVLCPPGYTNNESFRYYESIICGAIPVEIPFALSHMGYLPCRVAGADEEQTLAKSLDAVNRHLKEVREELRCVLGHE